MKGPPAVRRDKRSLSHVGGEVEVTGEPVAAALLAAAVDVPTSEASEELARAHVHGFHSYPARMHPLTARRLVDGFSRPGDSVLDPFCGSGTVLVEARLGGRAAVGVDANPLAVRLARLKITPPPADLVEGARAAAGFADARRKAKAGPTHRYPPADVAMFQPHVLLELDGIRAGLDALPDAAVRASLELVLSAILTKVSRQASDTSGHEVERRLGAGYPARLFIKKTEELVARLDALAREVPRDAPRAHVLEGDARVLEGVDDASIALVVTSPPYPGNYDYLAHHAARLRWLRLRADRFDQAEIGARRRLDPLGPQEGRDRFREELGASLSAARRVVRRDGGVVLLLADSVVAGAPAYVADLVREAAPRAGLAIRAAASQPRPHFHAPTARVFSRRPRREHAILLVPATRP